MTNKSKKEIGNYPFLKLQNILQCHRVLKYHTHFTISNFGYDSILLLYNMTNHIETIHFQIITKIWQILAFLSMLYILSLRYFNTEAFFHNFRFLIDITLLIMR